MLLPSFGSALEVVIVGARGGLGAAFGRALAASPQVARVHALNRPAFDITDPASIVAIAERLPDKLDLVLVATGLLHEGARGPEKRPRDLDAAWLAHNFAVNAIGPALVAQALLPRLRRDRKTAFAALSARVGSISDNRLGGWHSYRASKAALNQLVRTMAHDLARQHPLALCVTLHPGTVATALSAPFRADPSGMRTPDAAAAQLLGVLDRLTPADSGGFFAWDGQAIAF